MKEYPELNCDKIYANKVDLQNLQRFKSVNILRVLAAY